MSEMKRIVYKYEKPKPSQYLSLFETTGWNDSYKISAAEISMALENSWCVVAAYADSDLVGIGRVVSDGVVYAMLYDMIVAPKYQNKGIGTTLLRMLIEQCQAAGLREIQLFSAKGKAPFYRHSGFIERPDDAPGMRLAKPSR